MCIEGNLFNYICSRDGLVPETSKMFFVAAGGDRGCSRHHPIGAAPVSATEGR